MKISGIEIHRIAIQRIGIQRLLQVSGALIVLGLLVELASLAWFHPLSFVLFVFVGVPLIGLGVVVYLVSLVFVSTPPGGNSNAA